MAPGDPAAVGLMKPPPKRASTGMEPVMTTLSLVQPRMRSSAKAPVTRTDAVGVTARRMSTDRWAASVGTPSTAASADQITARGISSVVMDAYSLGAPGLGGASRAR